MLTPECVLYTAGMHCSASMQSRSGLQSFQPDEALLSCCLTLPGDKNAQWAHFQRSRFSWFSIRGKLTRRGLKEDDKLYINGAQADTPATDHDLQDRVGKADIAEEGQRQAASKSAEQSGESIKRYKVQLRTSPTLIAEHPADFWNNYETDIQLAAGLGVPACYSMAEPQLYSAGSTTHAACTNAHLLGACCSILMRACCPILESWSRANSFMVQLCMFMRSA